MKKIIEITEAEIDADDPDWRIREQINLYGKPMAFRSPPRKGGMNNTNP